MLDDFKWDDSMRDDFPNEQEFNKFIDAVKFIERYKNANKTLILDKERYRDVLDAFKIALDLYSEYAEVELIETDHLDLGAMVVSIKSQYFDTPNDSNEIALFQKLIGKSNGFEIFHNDNTNDIEINIDFANVFKISELGEF